MDIDYQIVGKFKTNNIKMIIVKMKCGTHVMSDEEWKRLRKYLYPKKNNKTKRKIA